MKILIVAAHPDDELLGVGGTALGHAMRGDTVHAVVLCEGVSARYGPERALEIADEAHRAARILGFQTLTLRQLPEQRLDTLPLFDVTREVEAIVAQTQPDIVYTHFGGDMNRDHRVITEAVLVATRPCSAPSVKEVILFETASSTEWGSPYLLPYFQPTLFVDVSPYLEAKIEALRCYSREVRESPHPRSPEALRARAQYWGSVICRPAAEPFVVARAIRN